MNSATNIGKAQQGVLISDTARDVPRTTIAGLLAEHLVRAPEAPALSFGDTRLSYAELDARTGALAAALRARGVGPDVIVAISLSRSIEMVIAVLATIRAGGAYVPLNPEDPEARRADIIAECAPAVLLAEDPMGEVPHLAPADWPETGDCPDPADVAPDNLALVLFTSGSTGKPKGVLLEHDAVVNSLSYAIESMTFGPEDRFLFKSPLSFDISCWEILVPLLSGGEVVVAPEGVHRDPRELLALIRRHEISAIFFVPTMLNLFLDIMEGEPRLKIARIIAGGEVLQVAQRDRVHALIDTELYNIYGPTEATVCVTTWAAGKTDTSDPLPLGHPVWNTRLYVLDEDGAPLPPGEVGRLWLAGRQLARGYLKRDELTTERFVEDPFAPGARMYDSGDLAAWREDGALIYHGRADTQIKLRGIRLELGEVEAALEALEGIKQAAVVARKDLGGGDTRLAAFCTGEVGEEADLRAALAERLPAHAVPSRIIGLEAFPLTASGKVDRPALGTYPIDAVEARAPRQKDTGDTARVIAETLAGILEVDAAGIDRGANFFDLGANSLHLVRLREALRGELEQDFPVSDFFLYTSIQSLAAHLDGEEAAPEVTLASPREATSDLIAIVGMAGRFPGATSVGEFWDGLVEGREMISHFSEDELDVDPRSDDPGTDYVLSRGTMIDPEMFDAKHFGIPPREADRLDPQHRIMLEVAQTALEDAGHDPDRFPGKIGIFCGASQSSYLLNNLLGAPGAARALAAGYPVKDFATLFGNDKEFLATRIAYKLNLKGPAMTVQTACSTALTAVSQGCNALRSGQADMVLAGGVSVTFPTKRPYAYLPEGMASADGHCRTFDAEASGTVFGDGAGLVVLRRLDDALADGDEVIAVIRGVGINNDGADKAGYAAPSIRAQAGAIEAAQKAAGITPREVGYIEVHGTATPLGDPIEFTALQTVFDAGTDERQFCALGSAKTNIGHLDIAAGAAGLIKAALVLKHGKIPPLLHYTAPNPRIDFDNSAFYPVTELADWPRGETPRIAGVSAFGVGGTNVHLVLEEAPEVEAPLRSEAQEALRVFPVSGSTPKAVAAGIADLGAFAGANPEADPDRVIATLRHGRRQFAERSVLVARDMAELAEVAAAHKGKPAKAATRSQLAFLFPGQGAQHVGMGRDLYENAPVFREALSICTELLEPEIGLNLLEVIHAPEARAGEMTARLRDTALAQPAIFAISYALAKQWDHWGIAPDAMVGHSIGEFAAATLAGVMALPDALKLIALRGRLMADLPPGVMVSVRASEEDILPYLGAGLDLAVVNGAQAVVLAGPEEAAEAILPKLEADGFVASRLHTSHAFHSHMMEPALAPFEAAVKKLALNAPKLPILSTVTGDWLTDGEATSADYWASHMRRPVRFYDAIQGLWAEGQHMFLEVGPGRTLSTLAAQNPERGRAQPALASLPHAQSEGADSHRAMLETFGQFWALGWPVDWRRIDEGRPEAPRLSGLPTYPFQRTKHWVEPVEITGPVPGETGAEAPAEDEAAPLQPADAGQAIRLMLSDLSGVEPEEMDGAATFLELGFDSLMLTQATRELSDRFGVTVTLRQLMDGFTNIDALAAHVETNGNIAGAAPADKTKVGWMAEIERPEPEAEAAAQPAETSAPVTRIARETDEIRPEQQAHIDRLVARFNAKTPKSKALTQEYRPYHADPRTASGFNRLWKEAVYQIVSERSKGSRLIDVDGNEYVDLLNGFGPGFLGHTHDVVNKAVAERLARGYEVGPQHLEAMEAARLFCEVTGNERASFVCTGSEAVYAVMRLARTVTNRDRIVMFQRDYHGNFDEVLVRGLDGANGPRTLPLTPGIPRDSVKNVVVLPYGTAQSLEWIRDNADTLAAVIVEPVQSRRPEFRPADFIREVRRITERSGTLMVFDEVVTGFRFGPRGAQAYYGVDADLVTYGKVVGGEMPVGVVAGKARFMDTFDGGQWAYGDDSFPEAPVTFFAGTFVRHPLAMAAVRAMLLHLKAQPELFWHTINAKGDKLAGTVNRWFEDNDMPFEMPNCGSLMYLRIGEDQKFGGLMGVHLRERGLFLLEGFPSYLTAAHDEEDIAFAIEAFKDAALEMRADGMLTGREAQPYDGPHVMAAPPRLALPGGAETIAEAMAQPLGALRVPTTAAQQEIWTSLTFNPDLNLGYNESVRLDLHGALDAETLRAAMAKVVDRHDALRSTFSEDGTELVIHPGLDLDIALTDLADDPAREEKLAAILKREVTVELNVAEGPLARAELVRMAPEHHVLIVTAHHIVCDGWSIDVVIRDLGEIYRALIAGEQPKLEPVQSIIDYTAAEAAWRDTDEAETVRAFWLDQYEDGVPVIDLPTDRPRTAERSHGGARLDLEVSEALTERLRARARRENVSFVTLLFAAWSLQMSRLARTEDLIVCLPTAGQSARGMPGVVGHCVHFLPIRIGVPGEESLGAYLQSARRTMLDAFDHQTFTLGELVRDLKVRRDEGRVTMASLTFNHDMGIDLSNLSFGSAASTLVTNPRVVETYELYLNLQELDDTLLTEWSYNTGLFERDTIERHAAGFVALLEELTTADADVPLKTLMRGQSDQPASGDLSDPGGAGPQDIMARFRAMAAKHGGRTALRFGDLAMDYATLDARSDALAGDLARRGIGPGDLVGISSERSAELVVAVLGVLKSGAGYVPFDTTLPEARLAFMAEDTGIKLLLGRIPAVEGAGVPALAPADFPTEGMAPEITNAPDAPSYVMFTSGTTGTPKAVVQTHRSVTRLIVDADWIDFGPETVTLHSSAFAFDTSIVDLFGALLHGGTVVIPPPGQLSISDLATAIASDGVNTLWLTSGLFHAVADMRPEAFAGVSYLIVGGDVVSPSHAARVMAACPALSIINGFGPTETNICTAHPITRADTERGGSIPIGRAVAGTQVYIVDQDGWPVPPGIPGELVVSGRAVANGYWNRPDLTAEKFHAAPWNPDLRIYRTGDLAALRSDGVITFFGRIDTQVKVRGFRVELTEVEEAIKAVPGVAHVSVAALQPEGQLDKVLAAYVVPEDPDLDAETIRDACVRTLPEFARPTHITLMDSLPLNPNGKVDRARLPAPLASGAAGLVEPATPTEERLLAIWRDLLGQEDFGVEDNFFSLGGHSLLAVRLFDQIRAEFGQDLPISTLLGHQTPRALASVLVSDDEAAADAAPVALDSEEDWDTTAVIHPGPDNSARRPVFIVGGVGGNVNNLFELGQQIGRTRPLIGFQTRGVMGHRPHDTIEAGAAEHIRYMRRHQAKGPYILAGYSGGAFTALEIVRQLEAMGEEVQNFIVLDTYAPHFRDKLVENYSPTWRERLSEEMVLLRGQGLGTFFVRAGSKGFARVAALIDKLAHKNNLGDVRHRIMREHWVEAANRYKGGRITAPITLFTTLPKKASRVEMAAFGLDSTYGWGDLTGAGQLENFSVEGTHRGMLEGDRAARLARIIEEAIEPPAKRAAE